MQVGPAAARGYDAAWNRLSKRARKLSPFCELCGSTQDLQADHKPSAWVRKAEGKTIRLRDVRVLCRWCNVDAGSSRQSDTEALAGPQDHRRGALEGPSRLRDKRDSQLQSDLSAGGGL